ncbi:MAG TPA: hypothetical protein VMU15_18875 [Anaeromyxobacter sp.]|nr:hypothetical protein [Anaeromyxobacter sp.]
MADSDPSQWRPGGQPSEGDSIAGQVASRIEAVPPSPGDAMDWAAVAARYERQAAALGSTQAAAELLFEAGRVYEERLSVPEVALAFYRRALDAGPRFVPNLRAVARLAAARGDGALAEQARRAESELGAAAAEPAPPPTPLAAALGAAQAAARAGDGPSLLEAWQRCAAQLPEGASAAHALVAASAVAEAVGDLGRAAALASQAFARCPGDPLVRSAARLHSARAGDLVGLAEVLAADAEAASGDELARSLLDLARVQERLGRGDQAVTSLERAWAAAPDDRRVLSELARLREARREWEAASDALEGLAAAHLSGAGAGQRHEAVAAQLRRLEIEEGVLARPDRAARCCREVLAIDPGHRTALSALGRICARGGDWEGALATLRAEAEAARDPVERAERTVRAAQALEERLGRPAEAIDAYRAALADDPGLLAARSALERLLERQGRWEDLCQLLEGEADGQAALPDRLDALFRLARIEEEQRGNAAAAAGWLRRVLDLDPGNAAALRQLHLVLERAGPAGELADLLAEEARRAENPRRRLALLERRAEVLEERARDPEGAAQAWEEVRAVSPTHPTALRALGRLHAAAGRWERVVETYQAQADAVADPAQAAELLVRAGDLLERRLSRPDQAVRLYREALTLEPAHLPALLALARLYRAGDEHEPLAEVLVSIASTREAPEERAAALVDLGQHCEERLSDPGRALEAYEEALRADPRHLPALRAAERLCLTLRRPDALAALRADALADAQAADRPERLLRLAWQELARTGDPAAAQGPAEAAAAAAPGSPSADLLELCLASDPARRDRALAALAGEPPRPLAGEASPAGPAPAADPGPAPAPPAEPPAPVPGAAEDPAEQARRSEERAAGAADPATRAAWYVQAGEAWERAGQVERALATYQAALAAAPAHLPALRASRNVFAGRRDWGAVRATLQAEGGALLDGGEAAAAWREAGAIAEQWFGDVDGAVQDYRAALGRDPSDPVALTRVEALLAPRGPNALAEIHAARAQAERDPGRAAEAWLAAARSCQGSPDARRAALSHLDQALSLRPDHAAALELRARLRAQAGLHAQALGDLDRALALGGEPATRLPLHLGAAALCDDRLQDPVGALRHTEAALQLAPENAEALARVARLLRATGRRADSARALRRLLAVPGLPREAQVEQGFALASLEAEGGDPEAALAACRHVLALDPGHPQAASLLALLERPGGGAEAPAAAAGPDAPDGPRREAAPLGARIQVGPPGSRAAALEQLRATLELEPGRDDVRASLAELAEEGHPSLALEQHRRLLARDPTRLASWLALLRLFSRVRSHDGAYVAASVLRWMGAPAPGSDPLLLEGERQVLSPPPPLSPVDLDLLRAPGDRGPLVEVVAAAGDALGEALADPGAPRGAPVRSDHPFRRVLREQVRALGAGDFELYGAPLGNLTVEPGDPAAVRVGADLAHRTTPREQRFLLGRVAARLHTRSALAEAHPGDLADAVRAAVRLSVPDYSGLGAEREELARRLEKAISRRARKALEGPARAFAHLRSPPDLAAWRAAASATADRAGLALCGDIGTALELLCAGTSGRKLDPAQRAAAVRACPEALVLLAFAATEAHLSLRQRLRVAIA